MAPGEGGCIGPLGRYNPTKIMTPPSSVIKIVKYSGVWGGGGGVALHVVKILQKIMAPHLSVIIR